MVAFVWLTLMWIPTSLPRPQAADLEKLRISITVDASQPYKGVKQRSSQLEETARDLRGVLEGSKWLEITGAEQASDVRLRILGRRTTFDRRYAIGYSLEAADFRAEDEFLYRRESSPAGGGAVKSDPEHPVGVQGSRASSWRDAARSLSESLEKFAEENYDRILAGRSRTK